MPYSTTIEYAYRMHFMLQIL